jgi:hypothetical protein
MSFSPDPRSDIAEELIRAHESELEFKADQYSHLHPETDYPVPKRSHQLVHRLVALLKRRRAE